MTDPDSIFAEHVELRTTLAPHHEIDLAIVQERFGLTQDEAVIYALRIAALILTHTRNGDRVYIEQIRTTRAARTGWFPWPAKTRITRIPVTFVDKGESHG